ncbi:hypothetical protein NYO91_00880 [Arhodomonas aquaeolei]|uniref:hypothetical protein n=1 Tax=Arhodomonas aquaeolei TaxID=2369 RepID=UPI002167BF07|nr:hypothetical protein [Arhodomonas aquaeolei]MCS4502621.1 hypothetical protein [Arhodomonas aquaeolei]
MSERRVRVPVYTFVIVGVAGYLFLVFGHEGLPDPGGDAGAVLGVLARLAPLWLVLWLIAAAGGAVYNRRGGRGRGAGRVATGGSHSLVCPVCGAPQEIRRGPGGKPRRVCSEAGEAHSGDAADRGDDA